MGGWSHSAPNSNPKTGASDQGWLGGDKRGELGVLNLKGLLDFPVGLLGRQLDEWIWGSDERSGGPWRLWPQSK